MNSVSVILLREKTVKNLNLDYFILPIEDKELNQYKILALLKKYSKQFSKNKLYPSLVHLNRIDRLLNSLYIKYQPYNAALFNGFKSANTKTQKEVVVGDDNQNIDGAEAFELVNWARPLVKATMDEGIAVYEYVYENMIIKPVAPVPNFKNEGCFVIPDYESYQLKVYEYSCSVFASKGKPVRSLKINPIAKASFDYNTSPSLSMGIKLVYKYTDLINPAIFFCNNELNFPFKETVFPIAKSKLFSVLTTKE